MNVEKEFSEVRGKMENSNRFEQNYRKEILKGW